ncbi:hypothetical protein E4U42_006067 [Claviceps africana]|uniref:Thioesterase domain-containing protein n=1 Tax=Claviceps africana TaxID=83212 RepID=A0A8K0NF65_9HYPO|nr:hypothetical protein E4U42_006067 [Claviceps africana]
MASPDKKSRTRADYPFLLDYRTRWNDNDMYDHVNNSVYNFLFDSAVNTYLIHHCRLHPPTSPHQLLVVHTATDYFSPIAYPAVAEVGLRVVRLGRASITYELGLFERGLPGVKAVCHFVHVLVERDTGRPPAAGMLPELRAGLERLRRGGDDGVGPRGEIPSKL